MKKVVPGAVGLLSVTVAGLVGAVAVQPATTHLERSVTIAATAADLEGDRRFHRPAGSIAGAGGGASEPRGAAQLRHPRVRTTRSWLPRAGRRR